MSTKAEKLARLRGPAPAGTTTRAVQAAVYEGAAVTRRTLGWFSPTTWPNQVIHDLTRLRDRSRNATRNDGYAKGVVEALVRNVIGTGIKPLVQSQDRAFNQAAEELWVRWTDRSDADGMLDWYGQQSQTARCWFEAGECFVRLRSRRPEDGLPVPLQVQVLEPEMCPLTYNATTAGGNRVRAGIEFDRIGRRVAYYFYRSRPGDFDEGLSAEIVRVPAETVLHVYKPLRAGQMRGTPHLTQALVRLRELDKYADATLLRQQLSAMFVAFLRHMSAEGAADALTGETAETLDNDQVLRLEPGSFQELGQGEEVQFSEPPVPPAGYSDYVKGHLYAVAAATGVPYQVLTGDMEGLNDRVIRVVLHEFRRSIQADQHQTVAFQLCRPVWSAWLEAAVLSGALTAPAGYYLEPETYRGSVLWMPQGWPYLHPVQDVQATKEAIRNGLTSRSAAVSAQGEDAAVIDAQQAADNSRADELKLSYDSDGRKSATGGTSPAPGANPKQPAPGPKRAPEPAPEE